MPPVPARCRLRATNLVLMLVVYITARVISISLIASSPGLALRPEHRVAAREFHFSLRALIGLTTLAALGTWSIEFARAHLPRDVVAPIPFVSSVARTVRF